MSASVRAKNVTRGDTVYSASPTPPDAGDVIEYQVTLQAGTGPDAHDLNIQVALPEGLSYEAASVSGDITTAPDTAGDGSAGNPQTLTWGRTQATPLDIDISGGSSLTFTFRATVLGAVEPDQDLTATLAADWTSLDGDPGPDLGSAVGTTGGADGERTGQDGAGGLNDYRTSASFALRSRDSVGVSIAADPGFSGGAEYRPGDVVRFTLTVNDLPEGTVDNLRVEAELPADMAFVGTVSVHGDADGSPYQAAAPFGYTALADGTTAPSAGATGTVTWDFGKITNASDNDTSNDDLAIVFEARVLNTIAQAASTPRSCTGRVLYHTAGGSETSRTSSTSFDVVQPVLSVTHETVGVTGTVGGGDTVRYTITVTNAGAAPAYNAKVSVTLPPELRGTPLANLAYTLGRSAPATDPAYDGSNLSATGVVTWTWPDAEPLPAGQSLTIEYDATVDAGVGPGVTLTSSARVEEYFSLASADSEAAYRKAYGPTLASDATITTDPVLDAGVTADRDSAPVGQVVTYTLTFPKPPVGTTVYEPTISADLPAGLALLSVAEASESGALGYDASATDLGTNHVEVSFTRIDPNQQAVVEVRARVANVSSNQAGTTISPTFSFGYKDAAGGTPQTPLTAGHTLTATEPDVSVTLEVRNDSRGDAFGGAVTPPDAGDVLEYRVTVENAAGANVSDAFDLAISVALPEGLSYKAASVSGGISTAPDTAGDGSPGNAQTLTWGRTQASPLDLDLAPGGTLTFTFQAVVLDAVEPGQTLAASLTADWTSLDGPDANERDGSGGVNDYAASASASVTAADATAVAVTRVTDTYGPTDEDVRIGDVITYRIDVTLQEGTTREVTVTDDLPAGLALVRTVSVGGDPAAPYSAASPLSYTDIPASATPDGAGLIGVSGATLTWTLGHITNTDTDNASPETLSIVYEVRVVQDDPALVDAGPEPKANTTRLERGVSVSYKRADGSDATAATAPTGVNVLQPQLTIVKAVIRTDSPLQAGATVDYRLAVTNNGPAPAYNVQITDIMAAGASDASPSGVRHAIGAGTPTVTQSETVDGDGRRNVTWTLDDASPLDPGETWTVDYTATVNASVGAGITLSNQAKVDQFHSLPASDPNGAQRQRWVGGSVSNVSTTTFDPPRDMALAGPATAKIGETVTFTITFPQTPVKTDLYDVKVTLAPQETSVSSTSLDDAVPALPPNLALVSVTADAACDTFTDRSDIAAGTVDVRCGRIPANQSAVITVTARVKADHADNQAGTAVSVTAHAPWYSDQTGGNNQGPMASADHTLALTEPQVTATLAARNVTRGDPADFSTLTAPDAGDVLEYRVTVSNASDANVSDAFDFALVEQLPAGLAYVTGSAQKDGSALEPTVAGDPEVLTWGRDAGQDLDLPPGASFVLTYRVTVLDTVEPGQTLTDALSLDWTSLDGADPNERDGDGGTGGLDDYTTGPLSVSTTTPDPAGLSAAVASGPLAGGAYRVGDLVTVTLTVTD
ncbi:isopeptide-forming domain-containing fimbrial protein, partial [Deferrisoma palaeochoriense]